MHLGVAVQSSTNIWAGCDQPHVFWPSLLLLFKLIKSSAVVIHLFKCIGCARYYLCDQRRQKKWGLDLQIQLASVQEGLWLFTQPSFTRVCEASSHKQTKHST
jgi:hypothetical protein